MITLRRPKMTSLTALFTAIYILCFLNQIVIADTLETTDGRFIEGTYKGGTQEYIWFQVGDELKGFAIADTAVIRLGTSPEVKTNVTATTKSATTPTYPQSPPKPDPITLPFGTRLMVRIDSNLDSRKHRRGHKFSLTLENNLVVKGKTISLRGSKLYGRLKQAKKSGRLFGRAKFDIELTDMMIKGVPYPIITTGVQTVGDSSTRSTVGTTAAGAGIGAITDGSDGAKVGTAIGLGLSLLRRGNDIHITSGTLLEFKLKSNVTFTP